MADITALSLLKQPIESQFAWLAGFFDGEGWFRLERISNKIDQALHAELGIGQNVLEPLLVCQRLFGGQVYLIDDKNNKDYFRWQVGTQAGIRNVIQAMMPYLVRKQVEAELILNFINLRPLWGRRDDWLKAEEASFQEAIDEWRYN